MYQPAAAVVVALTLLAGTSTASATSVTEVTVKGSRVHLGDLLDGLVGEVADIDLGPAPSFRGTRVIVRDELVQALHDHGIEGVTSLPQAVRVHRKLRTLGAAEVSRIVKGLLEDKLPRGTSLENVRAQPSVVLPDGWTDIYCDLPRPPHRTGPLASAVTLSFFEEGRSLWSLSVPVDLLLSQAALAYDVHRGSHVTFVIRRGLVEVSSTGTVTADADIGSVTPVVVMPSGRSLPARLEDANTAVMVDTP